MRQFALEQAARGVAVEHVVVNGPYRLASEDAAKRLGPLRVMRPAERELRVDLQPVVDSGSFEIIPHEGWLTQPEQFQASQRHGPPYLLERFYRHVRRETGVLMQSGRPVGGQFNFDKENRDPYFGDPPPAIPPTFKLDAVKEEVGDLIEHHFARHPGKLNLDTLPTTALDAARHWRWAKAHCLPFFGKFEDAMSERSTTLFHTRTSALVNLHRLLPRQLVSDAAALDIPVASKEGFIRQVLGWREFMHHVHDVTDGFRNMPSGASETAAAPSDGGYERWRGKPWLRENSPDDPDGGALPSALGADAPLPPVFWGRKSGLECMDRVVAGVWDEGWSHHITRLMILSNFATLLDVSPRELTDWFWVAYIDAYDWVVEPNVLGLGTFATGHLFTTKPYVSGANYIRRMSDYCDRCRFVPGKTCPFTPLYWAFLERHRPLLESNQRLRVLFRGLDKRGSAGQHVLERVRDLLLETVELTPENIYGSDQLPLA
jgi:deoxyribodipyrimidine photolyase-related protein